MKIEIPKEIYDILVYYAQIGVECTKPKEIDYHEYSACGKCNNCLYRAKLRDSNLKEFQHFWS